MTYLVLALDKKLKAQRILAEADTADEAGKVGDESKAPDFTVINRDKLAERSGPELITLFNSLSAKEDHVDKFENRERGAYRVLAAWDAGAVQQETTTEGVTKMTKQRKPREPRPPKGKRAAKNGAEQKADGVIRMAKEKDGKVWHKESARSKAYAFLLANDGIGLEDALAKLSTKLELNRAQVRGLIFKIKELKLLKVEV